MTSSTGTVPNGIFCDFIHPGTLQHTMLESHAL